MEPPTCPRLSLLPGADSLAARWFISQLFRRKRLAHHPTCRCFDNHLIRFGSVALCLGCSCLALGALAGVIVLTWLTWTQFDVLQSFGVWNMVGIGVGLFLPTISQPFIQRKLFKIASRLALGLSIACLWYGALVLLPLNTAGHILRGIFALIFWLTYHLTQRWRRRYTLNPCDHCPHGVYPFCEGNRERLGVLLNELRQRALSEDQTFVDIVSAMSGVEVHGINVEVMSTRHVLQKSETK